jgi:hypothetical protein
VALPFQVSAGVPGAISYDAAEPVIVALHVAGSVLLLLGARGGPVSVRSRRAGTCNLLRRCAGSRLRGAADEAARCGFNPRTATVTRPGNTVGRLHSTFSSLPVVDTGDWGEDHRCRVVSIRTFGRDRSTAMLSAQRTIVINRPVDEVFAFFTDRTNERRWRRHLKEVSDADPSPLARGSTRWSSTQVVTGSPPISRSPATSRCHGMRFES